MSFKTLWLPAFYSPSSRRLTAMALSLVLMGAALYTGSARAQAPEAPASAPVQAASPDATPPVAPAAPASAAPRYTAAEVAQMFGYIDRNKDGAISREEAAGFRGVARHFDEADTNKDNMLSREEFENAMNKVK